MTHRYFLSLAWPLIFATITVPLLGAVDTAVVGQLPDPAYIGGVAVGTVIFNSIYWLFGFLRVSTSGFASQALGADDEMQGSMAFLRPVCIGLIIGLVIVLFQEVIFNLSISFLGVQGNVKAVSSVYFHIRIWAAPFALMNYAILGWLLGMEQIKATVLIQVLMNILNIVLAVVLVLVFHLGVAGVAIAVLCAEVFAFVFGIILLVRSGKLKVSMSTKELFRNLYDKDPLKRMMIVNRDLFIRTICLLAVFNTFTAKGAVYGEEVLAANAILIQIHYIMAYFYDGLANAASILTGKAVGQRNGQLYEATVKKSYFWSFTFSAAISLTFFLCKDAVIPLFTVVEEVVLITKQYEGWLILFPLASSIGLVFYGIFAGAAEAGLVRNSMLVSVAVFLAILFPATHYWGNHGLWLSFIVFSLFRSILLVRYMPALEKRLPFMNKHTSA